MPRTALAHVLGGVAVAALLVAVLRPAAWASLPDFDKAYYPAGHKALAAPATLYDAPVVDFVNVPLVALLFAPFAWLSEPARAARLRPAGRAGRDRCGRGAPPAHPAWGRGGGPRRWCCSRLWPLALQLRRSGTSAT